MTIGDANNAHRWPNTGEFSDVTIICGESVFKSHKVVLLSAGSKYFDAILRKGFSESITSEIRLDDQELAIVARMLVWLYSDVWAGCLDNYAFFAAKDPYDIMYLNLNMEKDKATARFLICQKLVKTYAAAFRFDLGELQKKIVTMFRGSWALFTDTNAGNQGLLESRHIELALEIWTFTPASVDGLRDCVVESILRQIEK